jgi:hypothetical protein
VAEKKNATLRQEDGAKRIDMDNLTRVESFGESNSSNIPLSQLLPHHRALIEASAIDCDVAQSRGYTSILETHRLREFGFSPAQCNVPALLIPVRDVQGEVATYQSRPDTPRLKDGKPLKYETPSGTRMALDVPPGALSGISNPNTPLYITEGARKADSAVSRGLCCIALLGVWNWRGSNADNGLAALGDWESISLKGKKDGKPFKRDAYVVFDSDVTTKPGVAKSLQRLKEFLEARGARVKVVYLPPGPDGEKTGLDDFFARGGTTPELLSHARNELLPSDRTQEKTAKATAKLEALRAEGLPLIETNNRQLSDELADLAVAIERANGKEARLFHGAGGLVSIGTDNNGTPVVQRVTREAMQGIAAKAANWISTTEREGVREVAPPRDLCATYLDMSEDWRGIPPLVSIATAPFVAPDGSLCATPGYHGAARVWLSLSDGFTLPDTTPTPANVEAAKRLILDELLGEVAFIDEASRAHAVSLMLLPFVRKLIDGETPLHLFDAPAQGSGKTHAARICAAPFTQLVPTPEKGADEEWRKSLLCELATGPSHIFFDNITGRLNSSTLAAAITSPFLRDRLTGTGDVVTVSTRCVWVATSNNAQLNTDAASRTVVIRLDTNEENPESHVYERDPLAYVKEHRGAACGAILTLVRAWQGQGCPAYSGPHRSRFPQWQSIIGGILQSASIPGFLDNLEAQRATLDSESTAWSALFESWHEKHGESFVAVADLEPLAVEVPEIAGLLGNQEGAARVRKLGMLLHRNRDRIYAGLRLTAGLRNRRGTQYRVSPTGSKCISSVSSVTLSSTRETSKSFSSNTNGMDVSRLCGDGCASPATNALTYGND